MTNLFELQWIKNTGCALLDCRLLFAQVGKGPLHLNYKNNVVLVVVISNHADVHVSVKEISAFKTHTHTHDILHIKHSPVMIFEQFQSITLDYLLI